MNSLGIKDLTNKVVVLSHEYYSRNGATKNPKTRAFLCQAGFGCSSFTMGKAIFGVFLVDGESGSRVQGYELERLATKKESKEWLAEAIEKGYIEKKVRK